MADRKAVARATQQRVGATHVLAVLVELDDGTDRIDFGGTIFIAIATHKEVVSRRSRILGGREWVRLGAVEMSLDCCVAICSDCRWTSGSISRRYDLFRQPRLGRRSGLAKPVLH